MVPWVKAVGAASALLLLADSGAVRRWSAPLAVSVPAPKVRVFAAPPPPRAVSLPAAASLDAVGRFDSPAPAVQLPEHDLRLSFEDDFDEPSLARTWATCWWYAPPSPDGGCSNGTAEGEWLTPSNVSVHAGVLDLTARKQEVVGINQSTGAPRAYSWTSGMVDSHRSFSFTYGYVEWRATIPHGAGLWPALWLLAESGQWPPEIDALEMVGSEPNIWTGTYIEPDGTALRNYRAIPGLYTGWHTFGVDWEPGGISWYVDGKEVAASAAAPHQPMYLIMGLGVASAWAGIPDASTPFPSSLEVDYVRVWQSSDSIAG